MHYTLSKLKNGARLLHIPIAGAPSVTALVLFGVGSRYETAKTNGLSHFLEHMFFKGTTKRPSALMISEAVDGVGGEMNAFTSKEYTGYYIKVAHEHGPLAVEVLSDMLHNALFDAAEIDRERGVITQEIGMYEDQPMIYVGELFGERLFGDEPLGWQVIGTRQNIKALTRDDFVRHRDAFYTAENMVVVLSGGTARAKAVVEQYFGSFRSGTVSLASKHRPHPKDRFTMHVKKTEQTHLWIGFPGVHFEHPDRFALQVSSSILGGGMSSRLFMSVRERKGLAYYVRCQMESYTDTGYIAASAGVAPDKFEEAVTTILGEFKRIKSEAVPKGELAKAKEYMKGKMLLGLERSDDLAEFYGMQALLRSKMLTPEDIDQKIDAITAADITRVAAKYLVDTELKSAVISSHNYSAWLKDNLRV